MERAVIAIGVEKTGGLPKLQAAAKSAKAFADWAKKHQRIQRVRLITDEKSPVTRDRLFKAVRTITELGFIEQLIVYFSGHGINLGQGERWLLSGAPDDPAAAVDVRGSELNARFCGIGHVIFVSDACRTAADSIQALNVTGSVIFPNATPSGPERPVDQFYATLVGHPALEVKSVNDSAAAFRAAYSDVLLAALRGDVPELVDSDQAGRVIRAWPLKKHLLNSVPQYLRDLGVTSRTQQPDARIESEPTAWLSLCPPAPPAASGTSTAKRRGVRARRSVTLGDTLLPPTPMELDAADAGGLVSDAQEALARVLRPEALPVRRRRTRPTVRGMEPAEGGLDEYSVPQAVARASVAFGPDHFETTCGIKVRGAHIVEAVSSGARVDVGKRADVVHVSPGHAGQPANVALALDDGSAVVVPAYPRLIASLSFDRDGLLEDIAYEPSNNTDIWQKYAPGAADARRLRAVVAGTSALGVLRLEVPEDIERLLQHIRRSPAADPALATLAAYALHDRRMRDAIRLLDSTLAGQLGARVFDLALLAFSANKPDGRILPCVPLLTQGWSLLGPLGVTLMGRLQTLREHLRPSLWTHVAPSGAQLLIETIRSGKVG